ncbi:MAG: cellulase family glycosylhydrolase [Acidimicrobiales bacterium]
MRRRPVRGLTTAVILASVTLAVGVVPATGPAAASSGLPTLQATSATGAPTPAAVSGLIRAPGGPYLYDREGRVVFFHGVDAVYKYPPYELYPAPGKPWNFSAADASLMARLGFNVVRLGMTWSGLEPGTARANDPAICGRGAPTDPHQFNQAVFDRYVQRLRETVDLLGRFHIYTILDMHQDVYNEMFDGEGAPNWAVCTDGVPSVDPPGRWSLEYATRAAGIAFHHFWANDVRGDLQGEYDRVWGDVARAFKGNPWVLGYDPFNEPFSTSLIRFGDAHFDAQLECFYTGTDHVGTPSHGAPALRCPRHDPADGVVPTIVANDPSHLIFDEPDNFASRGFPTFLGPMNLPNLVFNVHIYCGARSPVTGNPTNLAACAFQDARSLRRRAADRPAMASARQPGGPAWFVTEFGATSSGALLSSITANMDAEQVGWAYWAWKYYGDPTGSAAESLVMADGRLRSTALVLSRTYPQAVAGVPISFDFSPATSVFHLAYVPDHRVHAPTVIFVPTAIHYPHGYCARTSGGRVTSAPGSDLLQVRNARSGHRVTVVVTPGGCTTP